MRFSEKTKLEAARLIEAMRAADVPAFMPSEFSLADRDRVHLLIRLAKEHCRIQERYCSENLSDPARSRVESRERNLEQEIHALATYFGLKADLTGDPRGYTVKLHAPQKTSGILGAGRK